MKSSCYRNSQEMKATLKQSLLKLGVLTIALTLSWGVTLAQTTQFKSITITLHDSGADTTAFFSFPAAAGLAEISPSTISQNPPDQVISNGSHDLVVTQTSGVLGDSLEIKIKPLDHTGTVIDNDSLVIGSTTVATVGNLVKILNKPHTFVVTGAFGPSCFGIAATFKQGDNAIGVITRTYLVKHVTNGTYHVKTN